MPEQSKHELLKNSWKPFPTGMTNVPFRVIMLSDLVTSGEDSGHQALSVAVYQNGPLKPPVASKSWTWTCGLSTDRPMISDFVHGSGLKKR